MCKAVSEDNIMEAGAHAGKNNFPAGVHELGALSTGTLSVPIMAREVIRQDSVRVVNSGTVKASIPQDKEDIRTMPVGCMRRQKIHSTSSW